VELHFVFSPRLRLISLVAIGGLLLLWGRLAWLQLFRSESYRRLAERQVLRVRTLEAPRGDIVDRNGIILATSRPAFNLSLDLSYFATRGNNPGGWREFRRSISGMKDEVWFSQFFDTIRGDEEWLQRTARILSLDADFLRERLNRIERALKAEALRRPPRERRTIFLRGIRTPQVILEPVDSQTAFLIESCPDDFPGIVVGTSQRRNYPYDSTACHIVGYLSKVTPEEYEAYRDSYAGSSAKRFFRNDWTGRTGIEYEYNPLLRGGRGLRVVVADREGNAQETIQEVPPKGGQDIRLTLDLRLQSAAEDALGDSRGAVVVLDSRSGEILALASSPRFNPNTIFSDYARLVSPGSGNPLQNRAIQGLYPLGSVFKAVTALAALEEGAITPETTFDCDGYLRLGGTTFRCWTVHGQSDLRRAIEQSCNVYFFKVGRRLGPVALIDWARRFGFGAPTGVDLPFEAKGRVPSPSNRGWSLGDTFNLSIGQGELLVTPLQVAQMMAIVANEGKIFRPHITVNEGGDYLLGTLNARPSNWKVLKEALLAVVESGTGARYVKLRGMHIAGKTGTAEVGGGKRDHGWFAGFAPYENPKVAFAVVIEGIPEGTHAGGTAGPVARFLLKQMFSRGWVSQ